VIFPGLLLLFGFEEEMGTWRIKCTFIRKHDFRNKTG